MTPTIKDNSTTNGITQIAFYIMLGITAVQTLGVFSLFLFAGNTRRLNMLAGFMEILEAINIFFAVVTIGMAVIFIVWMHACYANLRKLQGPLERTTGWAIGGWFIPLVSFVLPYQILNECVRRMDSQIRPHLDRLNGPVPSEAQVMNALNFWWMGWVIVDVIFRVIVLIMISANNPSLMLYRIMLFFTALFGLWRLLVLVAGLRMVKRMGRQEEAIYQLERQGVFEEARLEREERLQKNRNPSKKPESWYQEGGDVNYPDEFLDSKG